MANCELCAPQLSDYDWSKRGDRRPRESFTNDWITKVDRNSQERWDVPTLVADVCSLAEAEKSVKERFLQLAAAWSESTGHISSINDLTSHPNYQEIISLGWDVVPFLLIDLQKNRRFWFPALYAITKVRPFDPSDAGNGRRMTDAWIGWGKRKGLI